MLAKPITYSPSAAIHIGLLGLTLVLSILSPLPADGQIFSPATSADSLNAVDLSGSKTGYWRIYFGAKMKPLPSSRKARFYGYQFFDSGQPVYPVARGSTRRVTLTVVGNSQRADPPELLDGCYRLYSKSADLVAEYIYDKGVIQVVKIFGRNGSVIEQVDFTSPYQGQPFTARFKIMDHKGRLVMEGYWRKHNGRWTGYP